MKIALFSKHPDQNTISAIESLISICKIRGIEILLFEPLFSSLIEKNHFDEIDSYINCVDLQASKPDFLFSIGGDGTLLDSMIVIKDSEIPVLGINTGRLGFLANNQVDEVEKILSNIERNEYLIETRSVIEMSQGNHLFEEENYALNEFTIHKGMSSTLVTISVYINNEFFNTYWCDGLILSTPTGSTAYSMSCGGPIVLPDSNTFILTPVAPHNLNVRPVIVPDNHEILFEISGRNKNVIISLDSRFKIIDKDIKFLLKKSSFSFRTCRFTDQNFSKIIRDKLNWGVDKRNIL